MTDGLDSYTTTDHTAAQADELDAKPIEEVQESDEAHVAVDDEGRVWVPVTDKTGNTRYMEEATLVFVRRSEGWPGEEMTAYADDYNEQLSLGPWKGLNAEHRDVVTGFDSAPYGWNFTETPVDPEQYRVDTDD